MFLVVVMHSNVTYSGLGGWYYVEGNATNLDSFSLVIFGLYGSFTQAWFMGILFFIAAYFAARSLAKHGASSFVRERFFRLGVPVLFYMAVIAPAITFWLVRSKDMMIGMSFGEAYLQYLASGRWAGSTGPLWFAEVLLFFCLMYTVLRLLRPISPASSEPPRTRTILFLMAGTGFAAFFIRLVQPIGTAVANLQFSFFASYMVLFVLGIHAGERNWLESLAKTFGLRWFKLVMVAGIIWWFTLMLAGGALSGNMPYEGGWHWQSAMYTLWESFVAIGMALGLPVWFRKYMAGESAVSRLLARNNFGVFMFHAPMLIGVSLVLREWQAPMLVKHLAVAPLTYGLTLAVSELVIRRIPLLKALLR